MNKPDIAKPQPKEQQTWLVLLLRCFLGAFACFGISAWIYFGFITDSLAVPFVWIVEILPILSVPFIGHIYLFDPLILSFPDINYYFIIIFPALIWGIIGALLASGRKKQIQAGTILLVLYIIAGCLSYFFGLMMIPT